MGEEDAGDMEDGGEEDVAEEHAERPYGSEYESVDGVCQWIAQEGRTSLLGCEV